MKNLLNQIGLPYAPKLEQYWSMIKDWNRKMNLISYKTDEELIIKHFIDSIYLMEFVKFPLKAKVMELGTGGGFPGIPLAILNPEVEFTLVDSIEKKMMAVADMADQLGLNNVKTLTGRIEELGQNNLYRGKYDYVLARALAPLPTLLEYSVPFLKVNGALIAYKSIKFKEELEQAANALKELGTTMGQVHHYQLPNEQGERVLMRFIKLNSTASKYPRKVGMPKKKPL